MEHNIGPVAQIPAGEGRNFHLRTLTVAVFRTQAGEVFATQPDCRIARVRWQTGW